MLIVVEILVPLLAGLLVSLYLRRALCSLLVDVCGTAARSDFWVRLTTIQVIAFPLLLALGFGISGRADASAESVLRMALIMTTAGIVAGVAIVGRSIAKSIPKGAK
ncbi:hypothetical protein [Pseudoduganella sp.]|uniref:hypothetical protein n=1 Tax=Pseudoduganella sp. TaxID=1880898 RepID=UPI0035AE49E6